MRKTLLSALTCGLLLFTSLARSQGIVISPLATTGSPNTWTAVQNFNGTTNFGNNGTGQQVFLNGPTHSARALTWSTAGVVRYSLQANYNDDLGFYAYSPSGSYLTNPLSFDSGNQQVDLNWGVLETANNAPIAGGIAGNNISITNTGTNNAIGEKHTYFSNSTNSGFDVEYEDLFIPQTTSGWAAPGTGYQGRFSAILSPNDASSPYWGLTGWELDLVNRGADKGWSNFPEASANPTVGINLVCSSAVSGQGGAGHNCSSAYDASGSGDSFALKWYNGFQCNPNVEVAVTGRCFMAMGDITGNSANFPYGPLDVGGTWLHGITLTSATFMDSVAISLGSGQGVKFGSSTVANLPTCTSATAGLTFLATDLSAPTYNGTLTGGGSAGHLVTCASNAGTYAWRS
jgi:hypothetical protein